MVVNCKKCEKRFYSRGTLVRHQWKQHPEDYAQVGHAKKKRQTTLPALTVKEYLAKPEAPNGEMKVSELLGKLKDQQKFMNEVVALITNLAQQHGNETP